MKNKRVKKKVKGAERMLENNVLVFPSTIITIEVDTEPNWFTDAIERAEAGEEAFPNSNEE